MRCLLYIVLLGGLVLASVSGEVDSTRESQETSTFDDHSQTDDNEKVIRTQNLATNESFLHSPVNVRDLQTGRVKLPPIDSGGQVSSVAETKTGSKNSEERDDLSSEGNPLELKTNTVASVNRSEPVGPAAQVVNETASSAETKASIKSSTQGQRITAANRLLENQLNRSRTTTTANPITGHSDEESDDSDKETTTTARSLSPRNRISGSRATTARHTTTTTEESSEHNEPVKQIEATTVKEIKTTTTRTSISANGFGRLRTTTVPASFSNNSDEEVGLTKQTVRTTARSFASSNRLNRARTTTVPTSDDSVEEVESVSVVPATTVRSSVFANLFGRLRTTTPISRDSGENVAAVRKTQTTTVRDPVTKNRVNRFETTRVPNKAVTQKSEELVNVVTTTQTLGLQKLLAGNKFNRIRTTTTAVPISDTSDEVIDSAIVTQATTSRSSISGNRLSRFRTTIPAPVSKKDSDEQDETVSTTTTTTARISSAFRNRLSSTRTTTSPSISRDSIEEEDLVNKRTPTAAARSLPSRIRFGSPRTTTVSVPISANSDEDDGIVNKTETTTTRRFLAENRLSRLRTTVVQLVTTTSQNSDEEVSPANAIQTTTIRSPGPGKGFRTTTRTPESQNSEEHVDSVKKTQTTLRNSLLRNRSNRLQTTTTPIPIRENSGEQIDSSNETLTTSGNASSHISHVSALVSSDSSERDDMNNGTETTTVRNKVTVKYFNRYRTTPVLKTTSENSDEQIDDSVSTTEMMSTIQIPSTVDRPSLTPASKAVADQAILPLDIASLERKDRAIIYNTKPTVALNHSNYFQTQAPLLTGDFSAQHSDETDDVSEDDDISSILYSYIQFRTTTAFAPTTVVDEEDSVEVEDFSLELNETITDKPDGSGEVFKDRLVSMMAPGAQVLIDKESDDNSMEVIILVTNNSQSIQNKTAAFLQTTKLLMESDEGNDASVEGEGSDNVTDRDVQYQTTPIHQEGHIRMSEERDDASAEKESKFTNQDVRTRTDSVEKDVLESEERSNMSADIEVSDKVRSEEMTVENQTESVEQDVRLATESGEGNTVSAEGEVHEVIGNNRQNHNKTSTEAAQDSDEKDESSLEVDVSKLPEIKKLLNDAENDEASPVVEDRTSTIISENRAISPDIERILKMDVDSQMAAPPTSTNETLIEEANKKNEVNMKIRELLTNPIVQERLHERLQAIDGRLKDSKSARVKRLIEKYLAALAKLSPSANSATSTSLSVFLPLIITCLLLGIS